MFSLDRWQEIFATLRRNKLRTSLTCVSVAWGIFMLVILLGAGTGLQNNYEHRFKRRAVNSIWMWGGETSMPYKGEGIGRPIHFTNDDYNAIRNTIAGIEHITGRFFVRGNLVVSYHDKHSSFEIRATHPDHKYLDKLAIVRGRYLNHIDILQRRKVAVLQVPVARFLFGKTRAIGKYIAIGGLSYKVVGLFREQGGQGQRQKIYIPISTAQLAYHGGDRIHNLMFTVGDADVAQSKQIADQVHALLARHHHFSPDDKRAVRVFNNLEMFSKINRIFAWIKMFIWIIGAGTIVAGIVGVSNIMLISVKERTREIGVRKAVGATPASIIAMILQEAVLITSVSGYCGLVAGVGVLELVDRWMPKNHYIRNPQVNFHVAVTALVLLIFCGALAGFFPSRRAARVNPIAALRDE